MSFRRALLLSLLALISVGCQKLARKHAPHDLEYPVLNEEDRAQMAKIEGDQYLCYFPKSAEGRGLVVMTRDDVHVRFKDKAGHWQPHAWYRFESGEKIVRLPRGPQSRSKVGTLVDHAGIATRVTQWGTKEVEEEIEVDAPAPAPAAPAKKSGEKAKATKEAEAGATAEPAAPAAPKKTKIKRVRKIQTSQERDAQLLFSFDVELGRGSVTSPEYKSWSVPFSHCTYQGTGEVSAQAADDESRE